MSDQFKSRTISVRALNLIAKSRPYVILLNILTKSTKHPNGYYEVPKPALLTLASAMSEVGGNIQQTMHTEVLSGAFGDDVGNICRIIADAAEYTYTNTNVTA
jgi:hypothetical protein